MPTVRSSLILGAALLAAANLPLQAQAECGFTSNIMPVATSAAARVDDPQVPAP